MSKAVLVMDMPNFCDQCPIVVLDKEIGFYCPKMMNELPEILADKANVGDYFFRGKPDWCPLISIPQRLVSKDNNETDDMQKRIMDNVYADGWNDCLYTILNYHVDKDIMTYGDTKDE